MRGRVRHVRYEDLPAKARAQVDAQVDAQVGRRGRARTTRREVTVAESPGLPLSCVRCDFVADPATEARLAAHQAATGHGRFEWRPASTT